LQPKLKIAIIGPAHPLRGGIANFNEALARAFLQENIETKLFSFTLQYPNFLFPGTTQYDNGSSPKDLNILPLINSVNPFNWIYSAYKITQYKPDLIIVRFWLPFMGPCLGTINFLLRAFTKKKIIAITDNVIPHEKKIGDKLFTHYFIKSCDGFVAMSQSVLEDIKLFTQNTYQLFLPHPMYNIFGKNVTKEEAINQLGLDPTYRYLLFFGFIRKYKGLELLLKAFAGTNLNGVKLIIAGEFYEPEQPYLELIKQLNLADKVILKTNYIPSNQVRYLFCASDMVTQTYLTATQSGVAQIAYFYNCPMLVTNVGGLAEIVPNNKVGYVCNVNQQEITSALNDFFNNNRLEEFVKGVMEEKHRFEWTHFVKGILSLTKQIK